MSGGWLPPRWGRAAIIAACCAGATSPALAHPHIFIDASAELLFAGRTITAVTHTWRFDEAFSAFASQGLDKNSDRVLTETELAPLAKTNIAALEAYGYYTYVSVDGEPMELGEIAEYRLTADARGQLTLAFTLPIKRPREMERAAAVQVYDLEYYTAFAFVDAPVALVGAAESCRGAYERPKPLDDETLKVLYAIPATQRVVPPELRNAIATVTHSLTVVCE